MCAHAVRVALKSIPGVDTVNVSLSKGEASVTFTPGNTVRYEQLEHAIEKNGFAMKGSSIVADGTIETAGKGFDLNISGSNDRLRLESAATNTPTLAALTGDKVEVTGDVPEAAKGKHTDLLRYTSVVAR